MRIVSIVCAMAVHKLRGRWTPSRSPTHRRKEEKMYQGSPHNGRKKQGRGRKEKEELISELGGCVTSGWTVPSGPRDDKLSTDSDGTSMMQVPEVRLHDMSFPCPFGERWHRL